MAENYYIQKGSYLQFDATTIEQYIKDRLNANPDTKFTDHNFQGSYFSSLIEVVSYVFNVLMFYLNQTSTESKFTDSQIYENMNRIVKLLGYDPVGYQTSIVPYSITNTMDEGLFVIPRYSYVNAGGTTYTFNQDVPIVGGVALYDDATVLYQGKFYEYPMYSALGLNNEVVYLLPGNNVIIDHFNIHVYVKSKSGLWEEWVRTDSLARKGNSDLAYEVRFNENQHYEIKFGNGVNGKALVSEDQVAIYYLHSDGPNNELVGGDLDESKYIPFSSARFTEILNDLWVVNPKVKADASKLTITNTSPSTSFAYPETVEAIRQNAPESVKRKLTLSKTECYERAISTNYSNIIADVKVVNNFDYIKTYLTYFKNLGLNSMGQMDRLIYNQVRFSSACNFNNMYLFLKPKIYESTTSDYNRYVSTSLKQLIVNGLSELKIPNIELIPMDPVYVAVGFGINRPEEDVSHQDIDNCELVLVKDKKSLRNNDSIIQDVNDVVLNYFNQDNTTFGMYIDFPELTERILNVNGIVDFRIQRTDIGTPYYYNGLSLIVYNPVPTYTAKDTELFLRSERLDNFKVPYLVGRSEFINKIRVEVES